MPYDSFDAAADALAAANRGGESAPDPTPAPEQVASAATPEVDAGTTAPEADSFTNIDPNALPPELQAQYRNMQGAFTRRMQEVAEQAKQYESLGDLETAQQAMQLVQALQEDPVAVHRQLTEYLESIGHTPAQAEAIASAETGVSSDDSSFFDDDENSPLSAVQRELNELKQWKEQQEFERQEQAELAALQREEMAIRESDPNLSDDDIQTMYELAFAHGGSLVRASEAYKALRDRLATSFLDQKASVPAGVTSPAVTGGAQQPTSFTDLNDPELEKAAIAAYNASLS